MVRTYVYTIKSFLPVLVTVDANYAMESTRLTFGGCTQSGVARALIEQPTNAEKGLSHRFLWLFPKPLFGQFTSLGEINKRFQINLGKHCMLY